METLTANLAFPDSSFIEDTAIVLDEWAIITNPGMASRRGETAAIKTALAPYHPIREIEPPATIEGGDVLYLGRKLFVALSHRTNRAGVTELARILQPLDYQVIPVEVKGRLL